MAGPEPAHVPVAPAKTGVVASNLLLEAELVRAIGLLTQAGIRCLVLKGIPLARRLSTPLHERKIGDNDLLVPKENARAACAVLERDGYAPLPFLDLERRLRYGNQFLLFKRHHAAAMVVEVHWNAFPPSLFRVPESMQWAHAERFAVRGLATEVFDPPLTMIHLAAHFTQHGFAELRILREFARAWERWSSHTEAALALAETIGLLPAFEYALCAAAALGFISRPAFNPRTRRARMLLRLLPPDRLSDDPELQSSYRRQLLPLLLAEPALVPRGIRLKLFPPLDELASTYQEPMSRALWPRYVTYLMRPLGRILRAERPS